MNKSTSANLNLYFRNTKGNWEFSKRDTPPLLSHPCAAQGTNAALSRCHIIFLLCARQLRCGLHQQHADDDREDRVRQHVRAVVQHGVEHGRRHGHAHEFLGHILRVDRHARDEVDDKAAEAADEGCERELGIVVALHAEKARKADRAVGDGIVEDDGHPAHGEALGEEILERAERDAREDAPGRAIAHGEEDERDHHKGDRAAEAAKRQTDGNFEIAQHKGERDADAALGQAAGAGMGGRVAHKGFLLKIWSLSAPRHKKAPRRRRHGAKLRQDHLCIPTPALPGSGLRVSDRDTPHHSRLAPAPLAGMATS